MSPGIPDDRSSPWDQQEADTLIGQVVLVGLTYLAADGKTVTSQVQYDGRVVSAKPGGIEIAGLGKSAGKTMKLPPDLAAFEHAKAGDYELRSTGEIVVNPDLTVHWSITQTPKS